MSKGNVITKLISSGLRIEYLSTVTMIFSAKNFETLREGQKKAIELGGKEILEGADCTFRVVFGG